MVKLYLATLAMSAGIASASSQSAHDQAVAACAQLNTTQKFGIMGGFGEIDGYSRNSGCAGLCGRETFRWDNGPQGFGDNTPPGTSTQWPSTLNMGSSFDPSLAYRWGVAMGAEFWGKGTNIQEGPGINIARIPKNGRNFEYISGESPILGSMMVVPVIQGIKQNVMSISKHYILNNQETHRSGVNELVDEKTIMELYGVPFAAAAQHTSGVMCAYNRINGSYACENELTMMTMLKGRYNFSGYVVSDWGACHSTTGSLTNGLDIEMPRASYYSFDKIQAEIDAGNITMGRVDDTCIRVLSGWYELPEEKRYPCRSSAGSSICIQNNVSTAENKALAREISAKTTVLLKNKDDLLPLNSKPSQPLKVLVVGPDGASGCYTGGGGSGSVHTNATVCPLEAFMMLAEESGLNPGHNGSSCDASSFTKDKIIGAGFYRTQSAHKAEECCSACSLDVKCQAFTFEPNGGCYFKDNDTPGISKPGAVSGLPNSGSAYLLDFKYIDGKDEDAAVRAAKASDVVLVFGSAKSSEGSDRASLNLDGNIDELIPKIAAAAPSNKTAVIMAVPGAILTPWRDDVAAILSVGYPGEQYGPAIGDVLFGVVSPQAKLPLTFPNVDNEQKMTIEQYPGVKTPDFDLQCVYSEGLINGFRWYDKNEVTPAFGFGHGLTYGGSFTYSDFAVSGREVKFTIKRDGAKKAGCDTPQVYISPPGNQEAGVPTKVLRYFEKVCDNATTPAFEQQITYTIGDADVMNWDEDERQFVVTNGTYGVQIGSSSQDIRLQGTFQV